MYARGLLKTSVSGDGGEKEMVLVFWIMLGCRNMLGRGLGMGARPHGGGFHSPVWPGGFCYLVG